MARLNHKWRHATVVRVHRNGNVDVKDSHEKMYRDLPPNLLKKRKTSEKLKKEKAKKSESSTSADDQSKRCVVTLLLFFVFATYALTI